MDMKVFLALVLLVSFQASSAQYIDLDKEEFRVLYQSMLMDTYREEDTGGFAGASTAPNPHLVMYSVKEQRFISDEEKFTLLELASLNNGSLKGVPVLIKNRPKGHHFFKNLSTHELIQYLPKANLASEYILIFSTKNQQLAARTEALFIDARGGVLPEHHVELPELLQHINLVLDKKPWQVFRYLDRGQNDY